MFFERERCKNEDIKHKRTHLMVEYGNMIKRKKKGGEGINDIKKEINKVKG